MLSQVEIEIRAAQSPADVQAVRELWQEYWNALALPRSFQGFEHELESLPGVYATPGGLLLIACSGEIAVGTIAMRPVSPDRCEVKRLYVRPAMRGRGIARNLLQHLIDSARRAAFKAIYCDSLLSMRDAIKLYRRFGFEEVAPYSETPSPGAIYLCLLLAESELD